MQKGRKKKVRYIQKMPEVNQFSPRGRPGRPDEVILRLDHFEAIKLADYQGYSQAEGAKMMKLSRPSFGRILREARKLVADSIVNGKSIRINLSSVQVGVLRRDIPKKEELVDGVARESIIRDHIIKYAH
ncbi:MAG: DUF134 domain-containing protein [Candidatus Omnitrophica bacterium]|nr:DUF134 domain-containing protein [Candidatus Omnitrophota bacterium]